MLIRVGHKIGLKFLEPTPVLLMLSLHPSIAAVVRKPENLHITPSTPISEYIDLYGNRCGRAFVPAGLVTFCNEAIVEDSGLHDPQIWDAPEQKVENLPDETLLFLLASRYCEVDSELKDIAGALFNQVKPGWSRVVAICDFVHQHIRFDYLQARSNRTALGTYHEATGVCRDYMHLAITFCRAMNIPARYCTGYLGDIGVPVVPPMDFSAWFEAYLGGQWYAFDARNNVPRIGRIIMARGRDAADVALTTTFGVNQIESFEVWAEEVSEAELSVSDGHDARE